MKNKFLFLILFWFLVSGFKFPVFAESQNIFGLHLTQTSDIYSAAPLINSSGGDWGWTTIVIRLDQLDHNTWQEFFDNCRMYHIIPIIRLATIMDSGHWKRPEISDIDNLANFLNSLNWPSTPQYVILFNEINHSSEWGGSIDVKNFTDISIYTAKKFKSLNPDFNILSSPLDLAASNFKTDTKSAADVYREIFGYKPEYFDLIDGLASHSYPNHGYIGTPNDVGQHSIRGYQWELNFLKSLGINKTYPVFITETGWPHREGEINNNRFYTTNISAKFLINALNIWSADNRIKAITPFTYNYPHDPFDHFSWLDSSEKLYPEYQPVIDFPKNKNNPIQITKYTVIDNHLPFLILTDTDYVGQIVLKNTGQSIWGETKFCLSPQTTQNVILDAICTNDNLVTPGHTETFNYKIRIKNMPNYKDKTYISWENINVFEITAIDGSSTIYHPNINFKEKITQFFQNLFI